MGILDGFPPYALYLFEDSYEVGSTSLIDWNAQVKIMLINCLINFKLNFKFISCNFSQLN